jgi:hypothetical protein
MGFRVAKSLLNLRDQVNKMAPGRDTSSDGTIGDINHQGRKSDHNPNPDGVVTAMDITHDPSHGMDAGRLAEVLRLSKDPRIKYVISNRRIFSSKISPWQWRPYDGPNAHTNHVHISVDGDKALYDDAETWSIDHVATIHEALPGSKRFTGITATVFGGRSDPNVSGYDGHVITDEEFGVALPNRFAGARPQVRMINPLNGKSTICDICDVGPWNVDDPYWETGARPQAESGIDHRGRTTNLAGIDLTPAAARAIGIDGKGKVDWEFVGAKQPAHPPEMSIIDIIFDRLRQRIGQLEKMMTTVPTTTPGPALPQTDLERIEQDLTRLRQIASMFPQFAAAFSGQTPSAAAQTLSPIDKALGGEAMVGLKTPLAILAFAGMWIMQAFGVVGTATGDKATTTGQVLTALFAAFGGLGVSAKFDRVIKALALVGTILQKLAAAAPIAPKPDGGA